jgi:hypothetical protein
LECECLVIGIDSLDLTRRSQVIWKILRIPSSNHQSKQRSIIPLSGDYERFHAFLEIMDALNRTEIMDALNRTAWSAELRIFVSLKLKLLALSGHQRESALSGDHSADLARGAFSAFVPFWGFFLGKYRTREKQCYC